VYPQITVSLKFLLFYPNPKGEKRNFSSVSVQKWDTPLRPNSVKGVIDWVAGVLSHK
jgi:hypothetical protein